MAVRKNMSFQRQMKMFPQYIIETFICIFSYVQNFRTSRSACGHEQGHRGIYKFLFHYVIYIKS